MVNEILKQPLSLVADKTAIKDNAVKEPIGPQDARVEQESEEKQATLNDVVAKTASELNTKMQSIERDLQFNVDETNGDTIITVLDTQTKEVVRQIPTEEVLAIRENIESLKGILFSAEV